MRTRRHEVGVDLAVSFEKGSIIVSRYVRPFPNFKGDWQDVATFTNEQDWYASEYQNQIIGDGNVAMIAYHWLDTNTPA
jgi:hypothetical protein